MDDKEKIDALQQQLNKLMQNLKENYNELQQVQAELNKLKGITPITKPVSQQKSTGNFSFENFIGLKLIHIIGIVVLVIGLSIGVKYAIDKELISEMTRILLAYTAGGILFFLSWRLRKKYELFSAILFSGAMASLYFTTYAAFAYYSFYSFGAAFGIMIALTAYTSFEAVQYGRQEIAILGMIGAYSIPFLISKNSENAILFFSYILLINCGVAFLVIKMKWKVVEKMALFISWLFFLSWCIFKYDGKQQTAGFIILLCFYLLFSFISFYKKWKTKTVLSAGDQQNILINHAAAFLGVTALFTNATFAINTTPVIGVLVLYAALVSYLFYVWMPEEMTLQKTMAMLTVSLLVLYIGLQWEGIIVTFIWTALAAVMFFTGVYIKRSWPRFAAILLLALTLGKLILFDSEKFNTIQKIAAYIIIGSLLLVLSFLYQKYKDVLFEKK